MNTTIRLGIVVAGLVASTASCWEGQLILVLIAIPTMVCATSVVNQVTVPGTAIRIRINWPFTQLAVVTTSPAATMLSLMVVLMPTTLISTKLKTSLLL